MTLFATLFPLICWFAYNWLVPLFERRWRSLSVIMGLQRRRWVANATRRDNPLDAILSGNLMGSISFLASTSVILVLAILAGFGNLAALANTLRTLGLRQDFDAAGIELHLLAMLAMFALSFFSFTLALRQFNHFCIMIGALEHTGNTPPAEIGAVAQLNALAAKNFDNGIRAYYFAVPMVTWFASVWLSIAVTLLTVGFLIYREFFSTAHRVAASVAVLGDRHDKELQ